MLRLALIGGLTMAEVHANRGPLELLSSEHANTIVRKGYRSRGRASATALLKLTIAVKHTNTQMLTDKLYAVSTPGAPEYGQHMSFDELNAMVAPRPEDVQAVLDWLASVGAMGEKATPYGSFVEATVTVAQAETLLQAEYHTYLHEESGFTVSRLSPTLLNASSAPVPYTVPVNIARVVDFVAPTTSFPPSHLLKKKIQRAEPSAPDAYLVTPALLRGLYNLTKDDVGKGTASPVRQGVASFLKQYYDTQDLNAFWKKYHIEEGTAKDWINVPDTQLHKPTGTEASLDVQWLSISGMGVVSEHWSTPGVQPGNVENEPFVAFLTNVGNTTSPPSVFSLSYGDDEPGVTESYAQRCAQEFQMAGVRGITMLAAAGDSGAGCAQGQFVPTFPASCPYVTGVGGTTGGTPGKHPTGESAVGLSGGGFSNYFTRPSYQDDAVATYKKAFNLPKQSMWNANGAGFPDIAAQALQFDTCQDNFFYPIDGTSCACPAASGMWGLLQQFRMDAGMNATLGWINPLLYQMGANVSTYNNSPYNDVEDGGNNYCDSAGGFPAVRGWDAVTGWGTLDFGALKQILA